MKNSSRVATLLQNSPDMELSFQDKIDLGSDPTPKFHRIWDWKYNYNAAKTDQGRDPNAIFIKLNKNFNEKSDQGSDPVVKIA